jgi:hypothetical protein
MVGKQTIVFSGGEIVLGHEPKFWRFEITSAVTSGADIRPKTSGVGPKADVIARLY